MKRTISTRRWLRIGSATVMGAAATAALIVAVAVPSASGAPAARAAASSPLTMESSQETTLTDDFNPFVSTSAANTVGATSLIYEPMLQVDAAKPLTAPYDFLASSYKWANGGKSIIFTVRTGVKWSNGTPLTPADVAFTYNMLKQYPDTNTNGIPVTGATVSGNTVTVTFSTSQYTNLQYVAGSVYIVPQAIWGSVSGDPATYTDISPVGSGPYELDSFSATSGVTLKANPSYWGGPWNVGGGPPAVSEVDFPLLANISTVLSALNGNTLDWAGNFITGLQKGFVSTSSSHKVWFAPVQTNTLEPDLRDWPMNQLAVRKAVSLAIDRAAISAQGEAGLEPVATNASGLVLPNFQSLLSPAVKGDTLSPHANAAAADAVLKAAGYSEQGGWYGLKGKRVVITITDPSNYSDYALDDALMANELKTAHIYASFDGLSDNGWDADLASGSFGSATGHWSNTNIVPYGEYDGWLDSALDTKGNASGDFEGLKNTAIDKDLAVLAGETTTAGQLKALAPIEKFVATDLPVIPTVYGAAFDEYNTSSYSGWPTPTNAYESGSPNTPTNEVVLLHLKPVS
jgi:peptide/nickel transport system substrate-binding protein